MHHSPGDPGVMDKQEGEGNLGRRGRLYTRFFYYKHGKLLSWQKRLDSNDRVHYKA
jgi:hypothetical protein